MSKEKSTTLSGLTPDTKIGGHICKSSLVVNDMVILWLYDGGCRVFKKESISKKAELYKIDGTDIEEVLIPVDHELLIIKTKQETYFRDFNNQPIAEAAQWADYFYEPLSASFYRKDMRGNWYDIEGYRLGAPVFLKGNVLCSLPGRTSIKSIAFKGQKVVMSPAAKLIQVGKIIYDTDLKMVHYFGEKITGLGTKNISFGKKDVLQEIYLGLNRKAFINEFTKEPYLINNEEIIGHVQTVIKGHHRFEVFKSANRKYIVEHNSNSVFTFEEEAILLDFSTFIAVGQYELMLAKKGRASFYMEINDKLPFTLPNMKELILSIDLDVVKIGNDDFYNMKTKEDAFVFNETQNEIFSLNEGRIKPQAIIQPKGFENYYAFAIVDGQQKLFYKKQNKIIQLTDDLIEVKAITGQPDQKLINALSTNDEKIVLDARKGLGYLDLASSGEQRVLEVLEQPQPLGTTIVQNTLLQTLGGSEPRVIDLNDEQLAIFTLPKDLKEYPEGTVQSSFRSNPLLSIDFENILDLGGTKFLTGNFLSFFGNQHSVMLQQKNAKPLHLEGAGHRNELITGFNPQTLSKSYYLGKHRMIGAYTLTEDLKENELLFALDIQKSWLSFYESFLPIMKRVVELRGEKDWEYLLLELREISNKIEYIVVEKKPPYRVLVEKYKGKPIPKVVKSKEKVLKTPEEISAIKKIFLDDPGYLMEVD